MALKSFNINNPIILKLKLRIHTILSKGKNISFLWIPSHVGIEGNEMADELAKTSLSNKNINSLKIPYSDHKQIIARHFKEKWQACWEKETTNKLHYIKPKLGPRASLGLNRRDGVKYTRLRLGHSHLTHSFLLKGEPPPLCVGCDKCLTIKHILTECVEFNDQREKYLRSKHLREIFQLVDPRRIIGFLRETRLYKQI